jgi:plastocyanin
LVGAIFAALPETGSIKGKISFEGAPPAPKKIDPTTDAAICSLQDLVEEDLLVDPKTHGIKDAVVWVEGTTSQKPKAEPSIDNYRCRYEPHVLVVPAKSTVIVRNRDRFLHTTLAKDAGGKQLFNVALPSKDQEIKKSFDKPGVYTLACEVHSWMKGVVLVNGGELSAVSDGSGTFAIDGVPAGKRKVHVWQESLGDKTVEIEVKAGKAADASVALKKP